MRTTISRFLLAAAVAAATPMAQANPFWGAVTQPGSLKWDGSATGAYSTVSISLQGYKSGNFWNVSAGEFKGYFDPTGEDLTAGYEADDFFRFFCVDLEAYANAGPNPYTRHDGPFDTGDGDDATDAAQLSRLFDLYYPNRSTGVFYASGAPTNFGAFATTQASAAFQLAVWEIWYDTDMNLATGNFRATDGNGVANLAQTWLTAIGSGSTYADGWHLYTFANASYQDYLSVTYSEPRRQVPLPGTLALFGAAALAAGATRRKGRT